MLYKKLRWLLVSVACVIVCVFSVINRYSIERLTYSLIIVAVVFTLIGSVIQHVINQTVMEVKTNDLKTETEKTEDPVVEEAISDENTE